MRECVGDPSGMDWALQTELHSPSVLLAGKALLAGGRHTASVRALTPVDLLVMNGDDFTALAGSSSRFGELIKGVTELRKSSGPKIAPDDPAEQPGPS